MNIFELLHEPLKLKPPIRMFEAFSGIGTQAMALKRLGVDYEIVGFSEIDKYAIKSYHAIHGDVKNYGDITKMQEIPSCDIFTWSFPCTDLSPAGKRQGMTQDTRSGLVYDVLRLVRDTKDKPKVLIMENVPALISKTFIDEFENIKRDLEKQGYTNYVSLLNSKDYGIAQNRKRVFMVSVFGDETYEFPKSKTITKTLEEFLENNVDDIFYLNDKTIERISNWNVNQNPIPRAKTKNDLSYTITTRVAESDAGGMSSSMLLIKEDDGRFRKYTPRECWRLMGCSDDDFDKAQAVCTNGQLYKQAGNAIVVDVFEAILKNMIGE